MELRRAVSRGGFCRGQDKESVLFQVSHSLLEEGWGVSVMRITSLVLATEFQVDWLKVTFLREAETAVRY